jgi:hypothetical protein
VEFVAKAVKVPAADLAGYEWDGRTSKYHRTQIRRHTGFRECAVADADNATDWLVERACQSERRPERVRASLLAYLREERIEPPASGQSQDTGKEVQARTGDPAGSGPGLLYGQSRRQFLTRRPARYFSDRA